MVKVEKVVSILDVGKILNEKSAKSQIMGGTIFGIGMAVIKGNACDPNTGRIVTKDLADCHAPAHAYRTEFEKQFTDNPDYNISAVVSRRAGEIGTTGTAAAISCAVYSATSEHVHDLPITPDKLLC